MGFFKTIKEAANAVKGDDPIVGAVLGRGVITAVEPTGTSVNVGGIEHYFCRISLEVALDDQPRYRATCTQKMTPWAIAQTQPGITSVAVQVDPDQRGHVRIDWATVPPVVRAAPPEPGATSAADVLANGESCTVAVLQFLDMGVVSPAGLPVYSLSLTVLRDDGKPYQVQVGNSVDPAAIPLLYPGARLPAKVLADAPNSVVVDFRAALAAP